MNGIVNALDTSALPGEFPIEVYQFGAAGFFALVLMLGWRLLNDTGKIVIGIAICAFILWAVFG